MHHTPDSLSGGVGVAHLSRAELRSGPPSPPSTAAELVIRYYSMHGGTSTASCRQQRQSLSATTLCRQITIDCNLK
jgi:hypothetical protein